MRPEEWAEAKAAGAFAGSADDKRDGFLHFSAAGQVRETARRHFSQGDGLRLIAAEPGALGAALKWEVSRGGALFPHLYGALPLSAVASVTVLERGPGGELKFPPEFP
jgi:uncharacterized protein (DUF952 family)